MAKLLVFFMGFLTLVSIASPAKAEDLKPGQQKAKNKMMEDSDLLRQLKRTNEACGADLKITADFSDFSMDEWANQGVAGRLETIVLAVQHVCQDKAYKPSLVKSLNTVHASFGGRGGPDPLPNYSWAHGTLTYKMNKENHNLLENAEKFIRNQLDK